MLPARVFYGWRVVVAAFLMAVFSWGVCFYGPSVYVNELVRTRGWPVGIVSAAVTFHFLFSAVLILFLADAHRRFGVVSVTVAGIVLSGLGVIGWAHARETWHLIPAAMLTGAGWSALSGAAINAFIAPWFDAKRPMALSHAFNGASMGGVVFSPLWAFLIGAYGFETATLVVAFGGLALLAPVAVRYFSQSPVALGLQPDGNASTATRPSLVNDVPLTGGQLFRNRSFLTLSIAFSIGIFAQMGLLTHLMVRLTPTLGPQGAALALSLATLCAMIGRIVLGALIGADRRRQAGAANFCMQAVGTLLLVVGETPSVLLASCVLFGLGIGNLLSLPPLILQAEQRPVDVPRALALLTAVNTFLYAFAPGVFGLLRDLTGTYAVPFALAAATQVLSAIVILAVRPPARA